jgi:cytochrome c biogenesis factor
MPLVVSVTENQASVQETVASAIWERLVLKQDIYLYQSSNTCVGKGPGTVVLCHSRVNVQYWEVKLIHHGSIMTHDGVVCKIAVFRGLH